MLLIRFNDPLTLLAEHFLHLVSILRTRERLCVNGVRPFFSKCRLLLGSRFEPRPNSRALGPAGSVINIGLSTNGCSHSENKFDHTEHDWQVQKFKHGRIQRLDTIQAEPPCSPSHSRRPKRLRLQGVAHFERRLLFSERYYDTKESQISKLLESIGRYQSDNTTNALNWLRRIQQLFELSKSILKIILKITRDSFRVISIAGDINIYQITHFIL